MKDGRHRDEAISKQFGLNLKAARRRAGVTQEDLGFRCGLHRTEIGLVESGKRLPRIDTLIKLASALNIHPGNLLADL